MWLRRLRQPTSAAFRAGDHPAQSQHVQGSAEPGAAWGALVARQFQCSSAVAERSVQLGRWLRKGAARCTICRPTPRTGWGCGLMQPTRLIPTTTSAKTVRPVGSWTASALRLRICIFYAHWQGLNPANGVGWNAFRTVVHRIGKHLSNQVIWQRPSAYTDGLHIGRCA